MTSQDKVFGAILRRSIRSGRVRTIEEIQDRCGHFRFDDDRHAIIRHTSRQNAPWRFRFPRDLVEYFCSLHFSSLFDSVYLILICHEEVCEVRPEDWEQLLDIEDPPEAQTITVEREHEQSFRLSSGDEKTVIPKGRFPTLGG